jgi:hypothetical protein
MMVNKSVSMLLVFAGLIFSFTAQADGPLESGFLDDYSKLQPIAKVESSFTFAENSFVYARPGYEDIVKSVTAVVIPQPEIFIAPDSKYRGLKADDMKAIADSMRSAMFMAFEDGYQIADNPGPNTIIVRMALTNLQMKKRPRRLIQYLPPAYLATAAKRALLDDMAKNIVLSEAVFETETIDPASGETLGQLVVPVGELAQTSELPGKLESWAELDARMMLTARRLRCRLDNSKREPDQWVNCIAEITLDDVALGD